MQAAFLQFRRHRTTMLTHRIEVAEMMPAQDRATVIDPGKQAKPLPEMACIGIPSKHSRLTCLE